MQVIAKLSEESGRTAWLLTALTSRRIFGGEDDVEEGGARVGLQRGEPAGR